MGKKDLPFGKKPVSRAWVSLYLAYLYCRLFLSCSATTNDIDIIVMVNYRYIIYAVNSKRRMPILFMGGLHIFLLSFLYSKDSSAQTTTIANGAIVTVSASTIATTPGDINISAGVLKNKGSLRLQGSWANNGSFSDISGTVTFNATTRGKTISGFLTGANKFNNLVFNGTGGTWEFEDDAEVGANLSLTEGVVTAPPGILTLKGNVTQTRRRLSS